MDSAQPVLPGFALIADYSVQGDTELPFSANLTAIPATAAANAPILLMWSTTNISVIDIVGGAIDTGRVTTTGFGVYSIPGGVPTTTVFTMTCYDANGNIRAESTAAVTISYDVRV